MNIILIMFLKKMNSPIFNSVINIEKTQKFRIATKICDELNVKTKLFFLNK